MLIFWTSIAHATIATHSTSSAAECAASPANSRALLQYSSSGNDSLMAKGEHKVAWMHIPRAGTSFGLTVARYASRSLPQNASFEDWKEDDELVERFKQKPDEEYLGFKFAQAWKDTVNFTKLFWKGEKWSNHNPIGETDYTDWSGKFMAMFRSPAKIMLSRWYHFGPGQDAHEDEQEYHDFFQRYRGSTTQMLAGLKDGLLPNNESWSQDSEFRKKTLAVARERLKGFAFVGLTDEWGPSICLFHAMFGGKLSDSELENAHPGTETELKTNPFSRWEDTEDEAVLADVKKLFLKNIKKHCTGGACKSHVCKRPTSS